MRVLTNTNLHHFSASISLSYWSLCLCFTSSLLYLTPFSIILNLRPYLFIFSLSLFTLALSLSRSVFMSLFTNQSLSHSFTLFLFCPSHFHSSLPFFYRFLLFLSFIVFFSSFLLSFSSLPLCSSSDTFSFRSFSFCASFSFYVSFAAVYSPVVLPFVWLLVTADGGGVLAPLPPVLTFLPTHNYTVCSTSQLATHTLEEG